MIPFDSMAAGRLLDEPIELQNVYWSVNTGMPKPELCLGRFDTTRPVRTLSTRFDARWIGPMSEKQQQSEFGEGV